MHGKSLSTKQLITLRNRSLLMPSPLMQQLASSQPLFANCLKPPGANWARTEGIGPPTSLPHLLSCSGSRPSCPFHHKNMNISCKYSNIQLLQAERGNPCDAHLPPTHIFGTASTEALLNKLFAFSTQAMCGSLVFSQNNRWSSIFSCSHPRHAVYYTCLCSCLCYIFSMRASVGM